MGTVCLLIKEWKSLEQFLICPALTGTGLSLKSNCYGFAGVILQLFFTGECRST